MISATRAAACSFMITQMQNPFIEATLVKQSLARSNWNETSESLWEATANARPKLTVLETSTRADVVVIGSGYLGLSTALGLAEQGADVVLLDAQGPGFGASGRNGGQVIPGLKHDPDDLLKLYDGKSAEQMISFAGRSADRVFDVIDRYKIQCDVVRHGWIQAAHSKAALAAVQKRARQWIERGASAEMLDADTIHKMVGCAPQLYHGGWIDRRAGSVHPLNYALGLANAAISRGARLHHRSAATRIERIDRGWHVETASGATVQTDQVVVATNAYSDSLWPGIRTSIIAAQSFQIATGPLSEAHRVGILRDLQVVSDSRRLLHYYRVDGAGRLLLGGRGTLSTPRGKEAFTHIYRAFLKTFPQLAEVPILYGWSGRLAMTRDGMPHLHQPAPGITIALGCNGRGVALTTAIGQDIAQHLLRGAAAPLPFAASAIQKIPLHGIHRFTVSMLVQYYRIRDMF